MPFWEFFYNQCLSDIRREKSVAKDFRLSSEQRAREFARWAQRRDKWVQWTGESICAVALNESALIQHVSLR